MSCTPGTPVQDDWTTAVVLYALADAATPGPWISADEGPCDWPVYAAGGDVAKVDHAALLGDVDRLTAERDRARGTAATLEAENARLTEALYLTRITLEATFRVLQEASGLPDDIDDPDCRDEMVLALRPRAEKAEAEVARLREGIERMASEMQRGRLIPGTPVFGCAACGMPTESEPCRDHDEGLQHAGDMLRALLADTDSAQAEGGDRG